MTAGAADNVLRLAVSDFPADFQLMDSWLARVLERRFRFELDDTSPLLVCNVFGNRHRSRRATKVLCTAEPWPLPPRWYYDYSIGWQLLDDDRHVRVSVGIRNLFQFPDVVEAAPLRDWEAWANRPRFCNFVYSNPKPQERRALFRELTRRRFVHSPGAVDSNSAPFDAGAYASGWWRRKLDYLRQFRFTISFENRARPGYTSEKIVDALLAGTIPIYWGNPDVELDVDPSCFIAAHDFGSYAELAEYVVHLDDNPDEARSFFDIVRPLRENPDTVADEILGLFERARADGGLAAWTWRSVRPVCLGLRPDGLRARSAALRRRLR